MVQYAAVVEVDKNGIPIVHQMFSYEIPKAAYSALGPLYTTEDATKLREAILADSTRAISQTPERLKIIPIEI